MKIQFLGFIPAIICLILIIKESFKDETVREYLLFIGTIVIVIISLFWALAAL